MEKQEQKKILITGATGMIGQVLVKRALSEKMAVVAVVRNVDRAKILLGDNPNLSFLESDITSLPVMNMGIDYMIHAAANTDSRSFVAEPVNIITQTFTGTLNVLEFARANNVKGLVYLSSMEVYGAQNNGEEVIDESHSAAINTMDVRSCYPESKRLCENLCASYAEQYRVPAKVVRLTQTFGPGVRYGDRRVFAEFARCVIEGKDIVLHTKGETERSYLFTEDAASAIFLVLLKGRAGEAYNVANETTYCSIYEMACLVAEKCASGNISVRIQEEDTKKFGYAPVLKMNLDTGKIRNLGWSPNVNLEEMFRCTIKSMRENRPKE